MKPTLLFTVLIFSLCRIALADTAHIEIIGIKMNEPIPVGQVLKIRVTPDAVLASKPQTVFLKSPSEKKPPEQDSKIVLFGPLAIDSSKVSTVASPNVEFELVAMLTTSKENVIPPISLDLSPSDGSKMELTTNPLTIQASSNLQPGDEQKPVWIWGLLNTNQLDWFRILLALGILVILGLLLGRWLWRLWFKRKSIDSRTPAQIAIDKLRSLLQENVDKNFSYRLVETLKFYLNARAGGGFSDLTDEEVFSRLRDQSIPKEVPLTVEKIFRATFEVRYSHATLSPTVRGDFVRQSESMINALEAWIQQKEKGK